MSAHAEDGQETEDKRGKLLYIRRRELDDLLKYVPHHFEVVPAVEGRLTAGAFFWEIHVEFSVSIRGPFNTVVSELEKAADFFQEAAITGDETSTDLAKLCISRAYTTLKADGTDGCADLAQAADGESNEDGDEGCLGRNPSNQPSAMAKIGHRSPRSKAQSDIINDNGQQEVFTTTLEYI